MDSTINNKEVIIQDAYYQGYCTGIEGKPINLRIPNELILTTPELLPQFQNMVRQGHMDGREQGLLIRKKAQEYAQERNLDLER